MACHFLFSFCIIIIITVYLRVHVHMYAYYNIYVESSPDCISCFYLLLASPFFLFSYQFTKTCLHFLALELQMLISTFSFYMVTLAGIQLKTWSQLSG